MKLMHKCLRRMRRLLIASKASIPFLEFHNLEAQFGIQANYLVDIFVRLARELESL